MPTNELIDDLVRSTVWRAVRESVAALLVIIFCAYELPRTMVGSWQYCGCLVILISAGSTIGVVWSFCLGPWFLRTHPVSDVAFWHEAFRAQARLIRLSPAWYLTPLCTGMLLFAAPVAFATSKGICVSLSTVGLIFGGLTWLNRWAAARLDENARQFVA